MLLTPSFGVRPPLDLDNEMKRAIPMAHNWSLQWFFEVEMFCYHKCAITGRRAGMIEEGTQDLQ